MNDFEVEISRKVFDNNEGVSILITPCPENPDYTLITTEHCERSKDWYGGVRLALPSKAARLLASALLSQTN